MKHKKPTKEQVAEMLKAVKPLGFILTGETSMKFTHAKIGRDIDLSGIDPKSAPRHAIEWAHSTGINSGYESSQYAIRRALGLE